MCELLRESLLLWQVDARLLSGALPLLAVIDSVQAGRLSVQQAKSADDPVRWWLCWHAEQGQGSTGACSSHHPALPGQALAAQTPQRLPAVDAGEAHELLRPEALSRRKPCASTLGLLRSLRAALGVSGGARVRIAAGVRNEGAA